MTNTGYKIVLTIINSDWLLQQKLVFCQKNATGRQGTMPALQIVKISPADRVWFQVSASVQKFV